MTKTESIYEFLMVKHNNEFLRICQLIPHHQKGLGLEDYNHIQAPLSMEFPGKNTGVGCHFRSRVYFNPGIKPGSPALQSDSFTI